MTTRRAFIFLTVAFSLLPLVLPARQLAVSDSAGSAVSSSPEAAAVLKLVKDLEDR